MGYNAHTVAELEEATSWLREARPTVLAIDVGLLGPHWAERLESIRNRLPGVRVLFTASAQIDRSNGGHLGDLLRPPFTRQKLELALLEIQELSARSSPPNAAAADILWKPIARC